MATTPRRRVPQAGSPRSQDVAGRRAWRDRKPYPQRLAGQTVKRLNGKTVKRMIAARRDGSPHPERRAQRARPPLAPGKQSLRTVHHLAKRFQRFARAEAPRTKDKRQPRSGCRGGVNLAVANVERL